MTNDDLTIYHKGEPHSVLNRRLVEKQGLNLETVKQIVETHTERLATEELMTTAQGSNLKGLNTHWMEIQRHLQKLWGFEQDDRYIRFWTVPRCECPKMDSEDSWPSGYYTINLSCPLHGECNV